MTDLTEVHLVNRTVRLTPDERDEWARTAVKVFQRMQSLMTSFARVLTGDTGVSVVMTAGTSSTDGRTIYYRPPLMLGDPSPHNRNQCDKRDPDGHLICPACSVREYVVRSVTHEISHIVGGSFQKASAEVQERAIRMALRYATNPIAKAHLEDGMRKVQWGDTVAEMMMKVSPFLGITVMFLEDARIDLKMFKARPGTKKMFSSISRRMLVQGFTDLDGTKIKWSERPLNAQIMVGLLLQAEGFPVDGLHDKVIQDLKDPSLQDICARVDRSGEALDIAVLGVQCLVRLWELGYCEPPEEMPPPPPYEPPPPPQEEEKPDDQDEPEPEEGPEGEPGAGDDADSGDGSSDPGESAGDQGSSESPDEGEGGSGSDDSPAEDGGSGVGGGEQQSEADEGEPGDSDGSAGGSSGEDVSDGAGEGSGSEQDGQEGDDAGSPGDGTGEGSEDPSNPDAAGGRADEQSDADGDQDGHGGGGTDRPSDADSTPGSGPEAGAEGEAVRDGEGSESPVPGGESGGEDLVDSGGEGEGGSRDGESSTVDDLGPEGSEQPGPVVPPASDASDEAFEADGEGGSPGSTGPEQGDEEADLPVGAGDTGSSPVDEGDGDEAQDIPSPDETGVASKPSPTRQGPDGAGTVEPEPIDLPDDGTAEDVAELIEDFTGHNHDDEDLTKVTKVGSAEEKAVDKAIVQNKHFDAPTATVSQVKVFVWPEDDGKCEGWDRGRDPADLTLRVGDVDRNGKDKWERLRTDESIMQPAQFEMRRVFSDNRRTRFVRNVKKGKLDGRSLGRRAWKGDDLRLFQQKDRPKSRSYAVVIAGDISWSAKGGAIVVEKQAMWAQAELCHRMGVEFEVWAHTADYSDDMLKAVSRGDRDHETEDWAMMMHRIKGWRDPWNMKTQEGLAWLHAVSTNLDGHNLEFLRKRLMQSQATTKILLYYTDGQMPAANRKDELAVLKREVDIYKRLGIVMLGVGVGTDSPKRWGMDTVRINNKGDIAKVVKHLEGHLTGTRR